MFLLTRRSLGVSNCAFATPRPTISACVGAENLQTGVCAGAWGVRCVGGACPGLIADPAVMRYIAVQSRPSRIAPSVECWRLEYDTPSRTTPEIPERANGPGSAR
jgi:hypothetical protein